MAPGINGGLAITDYRVYWDSTSEFVRDEHNSQKTTDGSTTELVIQNLNVNMNYFFVVTARNNQGESNASAEVSTTGFSVTGPPANVSALVTGIRKITVSWSAPAIDGGAEISYKVYWDTASDFDIASALNSKIIDDGTTETLIDGLTIDTPYYFVITATNVRGEGPVSEVKSATPTAQVSSLISTLTLTIDGKDYPVSFSSSITSVDIDAMASMATVKEVSLIAGARGLEVNNELTISKGVTTIPITAGDDSLIEHIIQFRIPQITISATQQKKVDGTKSDGTKKFPCHFMIFNISTNADIKYQYSVEFILVKSGSTVPRACPRMRLWPVCGVGSKTLNAHVQKSTLRFKNLLPSCLRTKSTILGQALPTNLDEFRKTISLHSDKTGVKPSADIDVSMAYKSALLLTEKTSLYLAYDFKGNYPLDADTSYSLFAVQPQSTDIKPVSLGIFKTGSPVDIDSTTFSSYIESYDTASVN